MDPINCAEYEWLEEQMLGQSIGLSDYPYSKDNPKEELLICDIFKSPEHESQILGCCKEDECNDPDWNSNVIGYVGTTKPCLREWLFNDRKRLKIYINSFDEREHTLKKATDVLTERLDRMDIRYDIINDNEIFMHTAPATGPIFALQGGFRSQSLNGHIRGGILIPPDVYNELLPEAKKNRYRLDSRGRRDTSLHNKNKKLRS